MSFTLAELVKTIQQNPLNFEDEEQGLCAIHRAARGALNEFLSETKASQTTATCPCVASQNYIDVVATITDILPGTVNNIYITASGITLEQLSFPTLEAARELYGISTEGTPEYCSFLAPNNLQLFPTPSTTTSISFHYYKPLPTFQIGGTAAVTIAIEERYIDGIAAGAAAKLLAGSEDAPEIAARLERDFARCVARAKIETQRRGYVKLMPSRGFSRSYPLANVR